MNKIQKTRILVLITFLSVGAFFILNAFNPPSKKENRKPNVIIVLTDDQGYGDLSVHGNPILKTPVLDELHNESIRFTDFHSSPMCTPTRGELMTGRDAMDNGATAVCMGRSMVREGIPTMAEIFKVSGYTTAHFGKWHMGDSYPYRPQDRGFDETVSHGGWGIGSIADYFGNTYWNDTYRHNGALQKYTGYCTDVWFKLTEDYIRKQKKNTKPFFIYLATNSPHAPNRCDNKYSDPYLGKGIKTRVAKFFGQISNIDENIGQLLRTLKETKLEDNTILIYMTDNGTATGYEVFNAGMRGHKTSPFEGGHRVPFFIRWPNGNLGSPRDIDVLSECQDILPTLIDLCKLKKPKMDELDGSSLVPAFYNQTKELEERELVIQYDNPYRPKENKVIMWKKWRLVMDSLLYNISDDPGQTTDISAKYPEIVKRLREYYQKWSASTMPEYAKLRYIHLGSPKENPLMLYSSDWQGDYADNPANLFAGDKFGGWNVIVDNPGEYEITLYRWHPSSLIPLSAPMLDGRGKPRGAVLISEARLKIGNFDQTVPVREDQKEVKFTVKLSKGINKLETWFFDKTRKPLCSAYYTKTKLIN